MKAVDVKFGRKGGVSVNSDLKSLTLHRFKLLKRVGQPINITSGENTNIVATIRIKKLRITWEELSRLAATDPLFYNLDNKQYETFIHQAP